MSIASDLERQMLVLINNERAKYGLDPVKLELRLNEAAEDHSEWMLNVDRFSHTGVNGSSPGDRMRDADFTFSGSWTWAENIAWQSAQGAPGLSDDVEDLHNGLMNSPGHRANILSPNVDLIGIGIETGDYKGWDAVMVTQKFARTSAPVELDTGGTDEPPAPTAPADPVATSGADSITLPDTFSDLFNALGGNDTVTGTTGADRILGDTGNDVLRGLAGNDALNGGDGRDTIHGGTGNDSLTGAAHEDVLYGGGGHDRLAGQWGADRLDGGRGNDILYGGGGNDRLNGGSGNDMIQGHLGNDIIGGNTGRDVMSGGPGSDLFVFNAINHSGNAAQTADVIEDFQSGIDRIYLHKIDASASLSGNNAFSFRSDGWFDTGAQGEIVVRQRDNAGTDNDFTMVYIDTDEDQGAEMALRLTGLHTLTAEDFIL